MASNRRGTFSHTIVKNWLWRSRVWNTGNTADVYMRVCASGFRCAACIKHPYMLLACMLCSFVCMHFCRSRGMMLFHQPVLGDKKRIFFIWFFARRARIYIAQHIAIQLVVERIVCLSFVISAARLLLMRLNSVAFYMEGKYRVYQICINLLNYMTQNDQETPHW